MAITFDIEPIIVRSDDTPGGAQSDSYKTWREKCNNIIVDLNSVPTTSWGLLTEGTGVLTTNSDQDTSRNTWVTGNKIFTNDITFRSNIPEIEHTGIFSIEITGNGTFIVDKHLQYNSNRVAKFNDHIKLNKDANVATINVRPTSSYSGYANETLEVDLPISSPKYIITDPELIINDNIINFSGLTDPVNLTENAFVIKNSGNASQANLAWENTSNLAQTVAQTVVQNFSAGSTFSFLNLLPISSIITIDSQIILDANFSDNGNGTYGESNILSGWRITDGSAITYEDGVDEKYKNLINLLDPNTIDQTGVQTANLPGSPYSPLPATIQLIKIEHDNIVEPSFNVIGGNGISIEPRGIFADDLNNAFDAYGTDDISINIDDKYFDFDTGKLVFNYTYVLKRDSASDFNIIDGDNISSIISKEKTNQLIEELSGNIKSLPYYDEYRDNICYWGWNNITFIDKDNQVRIWGQTATHHGGNYPSLGRLDSYSGKVLAPDAFRYKTGSYLQRNTIKINGKPLNWHEMYNNHGGAKNFYTNSLTTAVVDNNDCLWGMGYARHGYGGYAFIPENEPTYIHSSYYMIGTLQPVMHLNKNFNSWPGDWGRYAADSEWIWDEEAEGMVDPYDMNANYYGVVPMKVDYFQTSIESRIYNRYDDYGGTIKLKDNVAAGLRGPLLSWGLNPGGELSTGSYGYNNGRWSGTSHTLGPVLWGPNITKYGNELNGRGYPLDWHPSEARAWYALWHHYAIRTNPSLANKGTALTNDDLIKNFHYHLDVDAYPNEWYIKKVVASNGEQGIYVIVARNGDSTGEENELWYAGSTSYRQGNISSNDATQEFAQPFIWINNDPRPGFPDSRENNFRMKVESDVTGRNVICSLLDNNNQVIEHNLQNFDKVKFSTYSKENMPWVIIGDEYGNNKSTKFVLHDWDWRANRWYNNILTGKTGADAYTYSLTSYPPIRLTKTDAAFSNAYTGVSIFRRLTGVKDIVDNQYKNNDQFIFNNIIMHDNSLLGNGLNTGFNESSVKTSGSPYDNTYYTAHNYTQLQWYPNANKKIKEVYPLDWLATAIRVEEIESGKTVYNLYARGYNDDYRYNVIGFNKTLDNPRHIYEWEQLNANYGTIQDYSIEKVFHINGSSAYSRAGLLFAIGRLKQDIFDDVDPDDSKYRLFVNGCNYWNRTGVPNLWQRTGTGNNNIGYWTRNGDRLGFVEIIFPENPKNIIQMSSVENNDAGQYIFALTSTNKLYLQGNNSSSGGSYFGQFAGSRAAPGAANNSITSFQRIDLSVL